MKYKNNLLNTIVDIYNENPEDFSITQDYINFLKRGGKIYIKPENRGKFTATMKRTGKTAEELSHSKNPITRKRAIFAINSRKWNKK